MAKLLLTFLFLAFYSATNTIIEYSNLYSFDTNENKFSTDNLNNIYTYSENKVIKRKLDGSIVSSYTNNLYGKINTIDTSDPLRILIFYKEFNQVIFLDNNLNPLRSPISLDNLEFFSSELVCSSSKGGFLIYDNQSQQIHYLNQNLEIKFKSSNLSLYKTFNDAPNVMIEKSGLIFVQFLDYEVIILDSFGGFVKKVMIDSNISQIINNNIMYRNNNFICKFNVDLMTYDTITFKQNINLENIRFENNYMFSKTENKINVYKLLNNF